MKDTASLLSHLLDFGEIHPTFTTLNPGNLLSRELGGLATLWRKHLKKLSILFVFTLLFFALAANAGNSIRQTASNSPCQGARCGASVGNSTGSSIPGTLFYSGDFNENDPNANGLANETDAIVSGSPYGAATYQNFVVGGSGWNVTGLFTNNLSQLTPTSGYWEVRSGLSEGNGGTLVASGTGSLTNTPTGRTGFGYTEYTNQVSGLNLNLGAGTYWESVVPVCPSCDGRSFNSNTTGTNSIGTDVPDNQYWNSAFFGANFTNADTQGVFQGFSAGVVGTEVPEPSSLIMLGSGLVAAAGLVRRRLL